MIERKHTPGPWEQIGNTVYSSDKYEARICDCNDRDGNAYSDEAVGNASLIASAPELLINLEAMCGWFEIAAEKAGWNPDNGRASFKSLEAALSVILKARGKAF